MLRQSIQPVLRASRLPAYRSFSSAVVRMGEGDTGAPKPGGMSGMASADAWTDRERSQENMYVRQKEMDKLKQLKEKLKKQRQHLDELDAHIAELTKDHGGEQN